MLEVFKVSLVVIALIAVVIWMVHEANKEDNKDDKK